jgi:5-formyltetrahydrofolate cyclo-ligase
MGENCDREKAVLRRTLMSARERLLREDAVRLSRIACLRVVDLAAFVAARAVVVYRPIGNELDPGVVAEAATQAGKLLYYPHPHGEEIGFRRFAPDASEALVANETLFVVPGVAFDKRGVRLGRGGGWYDRALARYPGGTRVGLAYDFQIVPRLPRALWDVPMHVTVTDARLRFHTGDRLAEE